MRARIKRWRLPLRVSLITVTVSYAALVAVNAEAARTVGVGYIAVLVTAKALIRIGRSNG